METKELYAEYLGKGYHTKIRKKISVDDALLPDRIIDADANIGAMKQLVSPAIETMQRFGKFVNTEKQYKQLQDAAINLLCGVLCLALKSRTSAPPYNTKEYQRNWDKKHKKFIQYGNSQLMELMKMGGDSLCMK
ncbi:hypothetical protein [Ruminiclostridium josui]|uniref:hypothetical protein n=1 Tax=Ruminiclostridium josui TaxID=1499 RepID=UPI0004672516|nr:hypothetical protein [Ruminiclostridium josui]